MEIARHRGRRVLRSQEILRDASVLDDAGRGDRRVRGLTLLPGAHEGAQESRRQEARGALLPPDLYARWVKQKELYLRGTKGLEDLATAVRAPTSCAGRAIDKLNLRERGVVWEAVGKLVKKRTSPHRPRRRSSSTSSRTRCAARSRSSRASRWPTSNAWPSDARLTEALSNRDVEDARARAWATADLERLAALPPLPNPVSTLHMAVWDRGGARAHSRRHPRADCTRLWIAVRSVSSSKNQTTFAIVPLAKLTRDDGYLTRLGAKGYVIEAPR